MSSNNARKVAEVVLETIGKGKKVSVLKIAPKYGYKKTTAGSGQIQKTKTYQDVMKPAIERYQKELHSILDAMEKKNKNSEQYKTLVEAMDKIQKQIQLLSGKATGRMELSELLSEIN